MPAVREIAENAADNGNRFSEIVLGIVASDAFQMRVAESPDAELVARAGNQ
jgi:hypothetical protein